ncbi:hypothetical protein CANDROIZ_110019 [Candidatus Roizmanbacteria bacterium]|nr:hypothetical protein CANDROIZ_110019 [Candidatus Roizmanbacteria bacterium]
MSSAERQEKPLRKFRVRLLHPQTLESEGGCNNGYGFGYLMSEVTVKVKAGTASEAIISQEVTDKRCENCHVNLEVVGTSLSK